ncbi:MAG: formylglycine-generating enzyme family protein [Paramuribaculum sp.]|nr:formylglycine-generating enzyme family protein [Paramuribaculum sp.]MDE6304482.1 formylglycine-generating enzyme family protein [Paramuribaculum sp.]
MGLSRSSGSRYSSSSGGGNVESFTVNGVTFEMVRVDGGSFMMGSYSGANDEQPVHSETVSTFYIGKTEVTQALWAAVMGNNPSYFRGETRPVEQVSWYDCQEFVERLSRLTGRIFRLPTEAEWEFAARGGTRSRGYTYSGSDDVYRVAWYAENSGATTHPVAQKLDNELGLYDMSGNVWEWTSDNYSSNYNSPRNSSNRVARGGSWGNSAPGCRVASRYFNSPGNRDADVGLRLAL